MFDPVAFEIIGQAPTLEHYRRGWVPGPGLGLSGIWIGAVASDASGRDYWGVRGCEDFITGMTHVVCAGLWLPVAAQAARRRCAAFVPRVLDARLVRTDAVQREWRQRSDALSERTKSSVKSKGFTGTTRATDGSCTDGP